MAQILSDIFEIKHSKVRTASDIERLLGENFGEIVRWAVIEANDNTLKLSFSYITK